MFSLSARGWFTTILFCNVRSCFFLPEPKITQKEVLSWGRSIIYGREGLSERGGCSIFLKIMGLEL